MEQTWNRHGTDLEQTWNRLCLPDMSVKWYILSMAMNRHRKSIASIGSIRVILYVSNESNKN
jgi:hypothetical protein